MTDVDERQFSTSCR